MLMFIGTNLDVVQNPMLVVNDPQYLNEANVSAIKAVDYYDDLLIIFL
jgi:hypothetical protein